MHDYTETKEGLARFRESKYVQSYIGNSFLQAKRFWMKEDSSCFQARRAKLQA